MMSSPSSRTVAIWVLSNRLRKSELARSSSSILLLSSVLTVCSSSLTDCSSSLEVSSSSLVDLQLLIDRNHFLVRGLELLQCAFIFLDRRLQTLPRVAQFVMQLRQAAGLGTRRKIQAARDR